MSDLAGRLATLSPERRTLLQKLWAQSQADILAAAVTPQQHHGRPLPLSYAQERLWFMQQLEPQSAAYNVPAAFRLEGELHVAALQAAFNALLQRHEVLRTRFTDREGQPIQQILSDACLDIPIIDFSHYPEDAQARQVQQAITTAANQPFDLATALPVRAHLWRLQPHTHVLLVTMHHIAADTWSSRVAARDIQQFYHAYRCGDHVDLPTLPVQYADYAIWQRQWLQGDVLRQQLTFWQENLAGAVHKLELPTDYPRPATVSDQGARHAFTLSPTLSAALKDLSRQRGVTPFITLLAAYQVLLYRYSGQESFIIGSPIANRSRPETADLIGFFANTLALRAELTPTMSFEELLDQVRRVCLGAYEHEALPLGQLIEAVQPTRSLTYHPLFQVTFALQAASFGSLSLPDLAITPMPIESGTTKFDLTLCLFDEQTHLTGYFEYRQALFTAVTIQQMAAHWQTLLAGIVAEPERPISTLPLLSEVAMQQLVARWHQTPVAPPQNKTILELFQAHVSQTPDTTAVHYTGETELISLTYEALDQRANQLAHHLQRLGVGPDVCVGLCLTRSAEMLISIWGVLKAGGAYVPLDPAYPAERLAWMLANSQAQLLITQTDLHASLPAPDIPVIYLDTDQEVIASYPTTFPPVHIQPAHLAYLIYTSGSTGQPKGAAISHQNLMHATWARLLYYKKAVKRFLLLSSFTFDSSVAGLFWSLCSGGTLCLPTAEQQRDPHQLAALIADYQITHTLCLPALYDLLLQESASGQLASLETVIVAGEACSGAVAQHHNTAVPQAKLYNEYGPTEATVWSSVYACFPGNGQPGAVLPIGRPIANTQLYVLDGQGQPTPTGVVGELYISGAGVVRGYHHRPGNTAEKFVPDPLGHQPGGRLYRTGDKVRYAADGNIHFLGRGDHQVKIRGFRIELTEVEMALVQHPGVQNAAVTTHKDTAGQLLLVGYVTTRPGHTLQTRELRAFLQQTIPAHMIPSPLIIMEVLPRLPNGKINRRALPPPQDVRPETDAAFVPPQTATEQALAHIWATLLGVKKIGRHDNFFELGGHSLLATQLISRLRHHWHIEAPLKLIFAAPTLADLAASITAAQLGHSTTAVTPIPTVHRQGPLPLSFGQRRLWFLDRLTTHKALYNLPILVRLTGALTVPVLQQSLNDVVSRHESLRTTFTLAANEPVQQIRPALSVPIEHQAWPPQETTLTMAAQIQKEVERPFDLETGPLLRAHLWSLSAEEHLLLITIHHIVADGWSVGVFQQELWEQYQARLRGETPALTPLPIQYADFSVWQREDLQGKKYETQLAYWQRQLAGLPELNLPTDYPRPATPSFAGKVQPLQFADELTAHLQALSQTAGVSLFMTLMSAFQVMLARYSGQIDISVGTPIANRHRVELEPLIGFFANTLIIRTKLAGHLTFYALLQQMKEITLDAYAHQDLPFELVVEALQPRRSVDKNPLCQVIFAWQNAPVPTVHVPGLMVERLTPEIATTRFDLELHMWLEDEKLRGGIIYNTDLFVPETVQHLAAHFHTLLQRIVSHPHQSIYQIPLLTEKERQHILFTRNNTTSVLGGSTLPPTLVHQQVAAWARQIPDATAVVPFDDAAPLTYGQLNRRANRLAYQLHRLGVGPEVPVAVCLPRSTDEVVAFLGILKAGGAYVPLDPAYPPNRLAYMLADVKRGHGPLFLLTYASVAADIPPVAGVHLLLLDTHWLHEPVPEDDPAVALSPDNLAYIIYTSGSTGQPKGVQLTHRGLSNLVAWHQQAFAVSASDRATHLAGLGFDAAVWEIWPYLAAGATLYLVDDETRLSSTKLQAWFLSHNITHSFVPTPLVAGLLALTWPDNTPLRFLLTGGDKLLTSPHVPLPFQLVNNYGPTEYTVVTTSGDVPMAASSRQRPGIGGPIANTRLYVLDKHLQLVPTGVYGELYVGGLGTARGYLHQPGLTANRFIPDPYSTEPGGRLYRTGDMVRYLPDGRLAFGGRHDHQVQVRGFRIELGEIEAVLAEHPDIKQSVVLATPMSEIGERTLIAYLVPIQSSAALETLLQAIRPYLASRLPAYMWPADYVLVEALPLTAHGKVDQAALLNMAPRPSAAVSALPGSHLEQQIAAIWQAVLGKEQVGSQDNFFDLGGHSLLLVQIQEQLEQSFARSIPLTALFNHPTVSALAHYLRDEQMAETAQADQQQAHRRAAARQAAWQQRARRQASHPPKED